MDYQFLWLLIFIKTQYKYGPHTRILLDVYAIMKTLWWKWDTSNFWLQKVFFLLNIDFLIGLQAEKL